jgi:hypothetical protein
MKKIILILLFAVLHPACEDTNEHPVDVKKLLFFKTYPADLAVEWNKLQMRISRSTTGFGPGPATRAFAYSGLALYESVVEGIPGFRSVASHMIGADITNTNGEVIYYPSSANAAYASILRSLIPTANAENKARIDSLEAVFVSQFATEFTLGNATAVLAQSVAYGQKIAASVFEWSKTDGFAEALVKNSSYVIPVGPGLWERTPPALAAPINVYVGGIRTFYPKSADLAMQPPPVAYSAEAGSAFHTMVQDVYSVSQALTPYDIVTVQTFGDLPGNYSNALRNIQVSIQLVDDASLRLDQAVLTFAKHHMSVHEAIIAVFKTKYTYNLVRPITYIRSVLEFATWNSVIPTPPHPEYPAAHATVGRASTRSLEGTFGKKYSFVDRSHENLHGARSYQTLEAFSTEGGWSRVLGGIHYKPSVDAGFKQGETVADLINKLPWHGGAIKR